MADGGQSGTGLAPPGGPGQANALERVGALAGDVRSRFRAMPPQRRRWMGVSALLVAAACAAMAWYAGRTDWRVLFSGLEAKDTQQISQELTAAGIAYQLTPDGSGIEVDAGQVDKARMEVAAKGMPQSGRMGFELFDKPNWVGSEFDEKVMQELLKPMKEHGFCEDSQDSTGDKDGGRGFADTLSSFGTESMATAIAKGGGLGIAKRVVEQVEGESTSRNKIASGTKVQEFQNKSLRICTKVQPR